MALPVNRTFDEVIAVARTASIGATPAAGATVAPAKGRLVRAFAFSEGTSSGTIAVTVAVDGAAASPNISFAGGNNAFGSAEYAGSINVNEGSVITFTPSGGSGATIPGHFYAVIRRA